MPRLREEEPALGDQPRRLHQQRQQDGEAWSARPAPRPAAGPAGRRPGTADRAHMAQRRWLAPWKNSRVLKAAGPSCPSRSAQALAGDAGGADCSVERGRRPSLRHRLATRTMPAGGERQRQGGDQLQQACCSRSADRQRSQQHAGGQPDQHEVGHGERMAHSCESAGRRRSWRCRPTGQRQQQQQHGQHGRGCPRAGSAHSAEPTSAMKAGSTMTSRDSQEVRHISWRARRAAQAQVQERAAPGRQQQHQRPRPAPGAGSLATAARRRRSASASSTTSPGGADQGGEEQLGRERGIHGRPSPVAPVAGRRDAPRQVVVGRAGVPFGHQR